MKMNIDVARTNMLKQQLRTWHVLEPSIIRLLTKTPREKFVPKGYEQLAFADTSISLGFGRSMMSPKEEGRVIQELKVQPTDKVLLIGVDGGYLLTLLSKLSLHVYAAENVQEFQAIVESTIKRFGLKNVSSLDADINSGWEQEGPFDVIVLSGSVDVVPTKLLNSLTMGGRLFAVVGKEPVMQATFVKRDAQSQLKTYKLYETVRPRVPNFKEQSAFTF